MPIEDYNELKPYAKSCGYYVYLDEHPTIELNQSSRLLIPMTIFLLLGLASINSEEYFIRGIINLFIGSSFGIAHLIFKENKRKLAISIRKFKITELGLVVTNFNNETTFINKDNIEGLEITDTNTPFAHKRLVLIKETQPEEIILMKSMDSNAQTEEALLTIANFAANRWNVQ